jgi:hypothetical protein
MKAREYHSKVFQDLEDEMANEPWYTKLRRWVSLKKWLFICYTRKFWDKTLHQ